MKFKFSLIIIALVLVISLCGCSFSEKGATIYAFTQRMNVLCEDYELTTDGYIFNEENNTYTKFFSFNENHIMLQFTCNDKNETTSLDIVFGNLQENNTQELTFIKNSIFAFIDDEAVAQELLATLSFDDILYFPHINTKNAKIGNIEAFVDVTEIGTVITVVQNIP